MTSRAGRVSANAAAHPILIGTFRSERLVHIGRRHTGRRCLGHIDDLSIHDYGW